MPKAIVTLASAFLDDPIQIEVDPQSTTVERIIQRVMFVAKPDKKRLLKSLLEDPDIESAIVFTRTKHGANRVVRDLMKADIEAAAIHGNKSQGLDFVRSLDSRLVTSACLSPPILRPAASMSTASVTSSTTTYQTSRRATFIGSDEQDALAAKASPSHSAMSPRPSTYVTSSDSLANLWNRSWTVRGTSPSPCPPGTPRNRRPPKPGQRRNRSNHRRGQRR